MLIHVTRFVDVQNHVVNLVKEELFGLQRRIEFGDGNRKPSLHDELQNLWQTEFIPKSKAMGADAGPVVSWKQVAAELHSAAAKAVVLPINGFAKEALDYQEHAVDGRTVIAVGGDKLSRGLTLEGLTVSYFLRTTRMYDTLMQMGRWFGYRPGYLDLCRVFTTSQLVIWYRHIALAEAELRREFDYMVASGLTPEKYGLRVRTHPDGMIVTALNKMCYSQKLELSWAGVLVQTTQLPKDETRLQANLKATETLLSSQAAPIHIDGHETRVWRDVKAKAIADFVEALQLPPQSARASGQQLATFIRQQAQKAEPELTDWTVALISVKGADRTETIAGFKDVGLVSRTAESQTSDSFGVRKANILSPADEGWDFAGLDFDREWFESIVSKPALAPDLEWLETQIGEKASKVALNLTLRWQQTDPPKIKPPEKEETKRPNGRVLRLLRRPTHGLLLIYPLQPPTKVGGENGAPDIETGLKADGTPVIGIALSFPTSDTVLGVEYRVNKVWDAELQEDSGYDD